MYSEDFRNAVFAVSKENGFNKRITKIDFTSSSSCKITVVSNQGFTNWSFHVSFDVVNNYTISSENTDSLLPEAFAQSIKNKLVNRDMEIASTSSMYVPVARIHQEEMICPKCKQQIYDPTTEYCFNCGVRL